MLNVIYFYISKQFDENFEECYENFEKTTRNLKENLN